ncbi:MAG: 16S rRNA (cytosine(1402)-N(4))-methyltransferase RsmH [Gammaproteobacteria bacterium]|nr:16S rRNA (cytosine(1402)-N(4))-methyltransferase RsmH [Gammaproteobacteria bacterium]
MQYSGHRPVMLEEVIDALNIISTGIYVDLTFGRGGHAAAILQRLGPQGRLLAIDKDPQAVAWARARFADDPRFSIAHGSFVLLPALLQQSGIASQVNGILMDLGVSSPQLDDPQRGFSFQQDGPLDMRMNSAAGVSVAEWLAQADGDEIARVLFEYGEERHSRRIARAIVEARQLAPVLTTFQLADIISRAQPGRDPHKHPATRSFQALRIFINNELGDLEQCLAQIPALLAAGGRLVVISFHSLEDRIVKRFIRDLSRDPQLPRRLPIRQAPSQTVLCAVSRGVRASAQEVAINPRARSAMLRVAEKVH